MAKIFPEHIQNFTNETEEKVYKVIKSQLNDSFTVFYSRTWRSLGYNQDIECDFLIFSPQKGILILEVKGGHWERKNGNWYQNNFLVPTNEDPILQCRKIKHSLISLLKATKDYYYCIDYALVFPDCAFDHDITLNDLPFLSGYPGLSYFETFISDAMNNSVKNTPSYSPSFDTKIISHIKKTLMKDITPKLSEKLKISENQLHYETKSSLKLLNYIGNQTNFTINGCAGAGKTVMAIKIAKKLAKNNKVKNIFFTCYNLELANWLYEQTDSIKDKCICDGFLRFFEIKAKFHNFLVGYTPGTNEYFQQVKDKILDIIILENLKFDAIIVDEGQQFDKDWWSYIELMLENSSCSNRYIFYDNNQKLYKEKFNNIPGSKNVITLSPNVRNTLNIHKFSVKLTPELHEVKCNEIVGEPVEYLEYGNSPTLKSQLRNILNKLIINEGVSSKDIIILTGRIGANGDFTKFLMESNKVGSHFFVKEYDNSINASQIKYSTIQKFRGMEKTVVILTDIHYHDIAELSYLGASRARAKLIWLVPKSCSDEKVQQLKKICN